MGEEAGTAKWWWKFRITWVLWSVWPWVRYKLTGNCGLGCGHEEPYGFVAEAGCPVHDVEEE